ncbi:MAG: arginine--tRNA ligase [Gammaproteobacteria bacterium]|jgi:arginyl-tRNA synthetase|nr:arginine--tRNA ligase [Gammaproteobacteria bacterium]
MKKLLSELVTRALLQLQGEGTLARDVPFDVHIERARDRRHGDFACNVALALAKRTGSAPRQLADAIIAALPPHEDVARVDIAGPGFINFSMTPSALQRVIPMILDAGDRFGRSDIGNGERIQVEFVSANPTGPLHVGHGRGAAYGATVADLLAAAGFDVHREYYINDAGRQMDILAASVWLRYLELAGESVRFPDNGYRGDYVPDIARELKERHGDGLRASAAQVMADLPLDETQGEGGDREAHIDALVARARQLLGEERYRIVFDAGLHAILADIRDDLSEFGVNYDEWFSERSLLDSGAVNGVIERLRSAGHLYQSEGAWWFRSTDFGDEKDRVVVRENGQLTYFASDIAYHANKFERGFDRVIDIWGADHHGYVPRVKAALAALGKEPAQLDVLLVQFAILYRGGEKVQMSTRSGQFVTLRELRNEVGNDAARFFYVLRKCEQHVDFDLDLAKSQSTDNPVYYLQYAHARVCSVVRQLQDKGFVWDRSRGLGALNLLTETHEAQLITRLGMYPEALETAALACEPHQLAYFLRDLATDFHAYYNAHQFLVDDAALRDARLALILATRQVLANGMGLLGVSAPDVM